jgi:hypothetical protein
VSKRPLFADQQAEVEMKSIIKKHDYDHDHDHDHLSRRGAIGCIGAALTFAHSVSNAQEVARLTPMANMRLISHAGINRNWKKTVSNIYSDGTNYLGYFWEDESRGATFQPTSFWYTEFNRIENVRTPLTLYRIWDLDNSSFDGVRNVSYWNTDQSIGTRYKVSPINSSRYRRYKLDLGTFANQRQRIETVELSNKFRQRLSKSLPKGTTIYADYDSEMDEDFAELRYVRYKSPKNGKEAILFQVLFVYTHPDGSCERKWIGIDNPDQEITDEVHVGTLKLFVAMYANILRNLKGRIRNKILRIARYSEDLAMNVCLHLKEELPESFRHTLRVALASTQGFNLTDPKPGNSQLYGFLKKSSAKMGICGIAIVLMKENDRPFNLSYEDGLLILGSLDVWDAIWQ